MVGCSEYGKEYFGVLICGEFLDQLSDCQLLKKGDYVGSYVVMFYLVKLSLAKVTHILILGKLVRDELEEIFLHAAMTYFENYWHYPG